MEMDYDPQMRILPRSTKAFTLIELLAVVAIMAILAALLLPVLSRAKGRGKRTTCLNNLKQIAQAVHLYADDNNSRLFSFLAPTNTGFALQCTSYVPLIRSYVGLRGATSSSQDQQLFACPGDTIGSGDTNAGPPYAICHDLWYCNYSSYGFNAGNYVWRLQPPLPGYADFPEEHPGILGSKMNSIINPTKTVLVTEFPAFNPYSWHQPSLAPPQIPGVWNLGIYFYNNAPNMVSFVDGHVRCTKMYFGTNNPGHYPNPSPASQWDPPAEYDYKWSGD
jgi:prepilin-type N-terminal cleavage/methylation domain-containing protein/prepilin-type processing-associated H-X9-DG protein